MLHRCSHTLPWSIAKFGQPSDLPDVLREDLLILLPVDPERIFATWNISYQTQNSLAKILGEAAFATSRLAIHLDNLGADDDCLIFDISGPTRSRYLSLNPQWVRANGCLRIYGRLGYLLDNSQFYAITTSNATMMPCAYVKAQAAAYRQLWAEIYPQREAQAETPLLDPLSSSEVKEIDLSRLAQSLDQQLGRAPLPSWLHAES